MFGQTDQEGEGVCRLTKFVMDVAYLEDGREWKFIKAENPKN